MRKQKPFSRNRMLKSATNNNNSSNVLNNNTMSLASSAVNMTSTTVAISGEYLGNEYGKMNNSHAFVQRDRFSDGLNSITKSILQQKGVSGGQFDQHDDIPLRPLLLNGSQNQTNQQISSQVQNNE